MRCRRALTAHVLPFFDGTRTGGTRSCFFPRANCLLLSQHRRPLVKFSVDNVEQDNGREVGRELETNDTV